MGKNNLFIKVLVFLLGFVNLSAQVSAIDILEKAKDNALMLDNAFYKFNITSEIKNNLLPIDGEFYIKGEKYIIDTPDIDQIYDGEFFYTIIHENKEILISNENNSFLNLTPNQIFKFFLEGFDLKTQNISGNSFFIIAESYQEKEIIYNILINSFNLSIEKIEMKEKESGIEINKFLTITYDYNLDVPLSLFKFDENNYKDYIIITEN